MYLQKKVHMPVNLLGDKHKTFIRMLIDSAFQGAQSQVVKCISIFYCYNGMHFKH